MKPIIFDYTDNQTFNDNVDKELTGVNESVDIQGRIILSGNTNSSMRLNIEHFGNNTKSNVVIRAILKDSATLNISGVLHIDKNANDCEAYFEAKVLIVGEKARATIVPELKIDNKNVKAKHAVVIKKISEQELYFLESRGVESKLAKELISEGFLKI